MQSYWPSESAKIEQKIKCNSTESFPENNESLNYLRLEMKSNGFVNEDPVPDRSTIKPVVFDGPGLASNYENGDSREIEGQSSERIISKAEEQRVASNFLMTSECDLCDVCGELYSSTEHYHCQRIENFTFDRRPQLSAVNPAPFYFRKKSFRLENDLSNTDHPPRSSCPYCYNVYEHHELIAHISQHSNLPFICERCGMFFSGEDELGEHEKKHGDTVLCMNCFKVCDDAVDLIMHTTIRALPIECRQCDEAFSSYCAMHSHRASCSPKKKIYNSINNNQKVKCSQCPMVFATQQRLDDHFRQHTGERPFFCEHCLQTYSRKDNLNRHLRKNRIEDGLTCKCSVCQLEFPSKCSLKKHYTTEHPEQSADQCIKVLCVAEPSEPIVLNGRTLRSRSQYTETGITSEPSSPQMEIVEEVDDNITNTTGPIRFSCNLCSKTFGYRKSLSKHVRVVHSLDKLPHACHLCSRSFSDIMLLNRHVNWHKGAQHQCRECGICYSHSKHLLRHLKKVHSIKNNDSKVHIELGSNEMATLNSQILETGDTSNFIKLETVSTGGNTLVSSSTTTIEAANSNFQPATYLTYAELLKLVENAPKPYTCQVCGKPTDSKRNYLEHYMSHSKERPFKCDVCGQGFIRERRMLDHKVIHERSIKKPRLDEDIDNTSSCDGRLYSLAYPNSCYEKKELRPRPDDSTYLARFSHLSFRTPSIDLNRFDLYPATSEGLVQSSSSMVHFRCDSCCRVFSRRSALVSHQKACADGLPPSSEIPRARRSKPFKYLQSFEREDKIVVYGMEHAITSSNGVQRFTCGVCGRFFDKKNFIFKHTLIHVKDKPFKCALCMNRGFMTRNSLKKHFRKCHKGLMIDKDGNVFSKDSMTMVLPDVWSKPPSVHNTQTSLLADRLTQGYTDNHASKSPEHITVECDLNDMMSMFEPETEIVDENVHFTAPLTMLNQSSYPVHTIFIAQPVHTEQLTTDVEMPLADNYPDYELSDVTMNHFLEANDVDMEDVQMTVNSANSSVSPEELFLTCGQCNSSFETKEEMFKHYVTHDMANDPIKCATCDKEFVRRQYLQMHAMMHARPKRFQCTFCPKSFRAKRDMDDHIRTHTGEKPFGCEHCGRKFRVRKQLYAHRKLHVQPFQCSKCSASFSMEWSLKRHEKTCGQENQNTTMFTKDDGDVIIINEEIDIELETTDHTIVPELIVSEIGVTDSEETKMVKSEEISSAC